MDRLPIDEVLPEIAAAFATAPAVVLEAPPGAGKTTRVPWFLAERLTQAQVLVAQPRRLAAKLAAERVAEEHGEPVGETVGYRVRLEHVHSSKTRVTYMTDGMLLRQMVSSPELPHVGAVVLDEFHERRLHSDLCLALLQRLLSMRSDIKLLVMSATLDADRVAEHLNGAPRITSQGRMYPVQIRHQPRPDERPLETQVKSAVRELLAVTPGDVLVFLPGASEIRKAEAALAGIAEQRQLQVTPLHGDLPLKAQTIAVRRQRLRKVVLSTNVAESSVTVDNITGVVDSGLARILDHDSWSGMDRLAVRAISQASAEQRAGRAGRTAPGVVLRLYTRGDFSARAAHETPEIERLDLCEALLLLKSMGIDDAASLPWLTHPKPSALAAAETLLYELGATDASQSLTDIGRRLIDFPLHPRLARLIVEGQALGVAREACLAAALLSERDIRSSRRNLAGPARAYHSESSSDVLELCELYRAAEGERFSEYILRQLELEGQAVRWVSRTSKQLATLAKSAAPEPTSEPERDDALLLCLLTAFVDRLAQRTLTGRELLLANGKLAELSDESVVHRAPLLVALAATERASGARRGKLLVRLASEVREEWLFDRYFERLEEGEEYRYNPKSERVERVSTIRFGRIVLDETRSAARPGPAAAAVLLRAALAKGLTYFDPSDELTHTVARVGVLSKYCPEAVPELGELPSAEQILARACETASSLAELRERGLVADLYAALPPEVLALLEREAPLYVTLPSGRRLPVRYPAGQEPYIESRLQDFFSMLDAPRICKGRLQLLVHLLAPNRRSVQVTRDLAGFWERHYPALRRQLMRRYPKHSWPEDGRTASPPDPHARRHNKSPRAAN